MNSFLDLLQGKNELNGLAQNIQNAVEEARTYSKWRGEFMTLEMKLNEEREKGKEEGREEGIKEGIEKGRAFEILQLVSDGDISEEKGAEKLKITVEELQRRLKEIK